MSMLMTRVRNFCGAVGVRAHGMRHRTATRQAIAGQRETQQQVEDKAAHGLGERMHVAALAFKRIATARTLWHRLLT
ncbi:MAG: hypothetical protein ACT4NL_04605 [Pseudomarimonas sp.]